MKTLFEKTVLLNARVEQVYALLANLENYPVLFQKHTGDWEFEGDVAKLVYDGSTNSKLKFYEKQENQKIVLGTFGNNTFDFDFEMLMMEVDKAKTNFKLSIKSDMNPVFASMMESSISELANDFLLELEEGFGK